MIHTHPAAILLALLLLSGSAVAGDGIDICPEHPRYWQYDGKPVLLLGGSLEDNLFQIPNIEAHLDLLHSVGGNYVRCTMSCRDEGNVWPFAQQSDGRYDLDEWNPEYWQRFNRFLKLTGKRGIIAQIELWATFDFYLDYWPRNPFNPKNNINYTAETSELPTRKLGHPLQLENNWFWSIPAERNHKVVLRHQRRFVDKVLSCTLKHGHVLYCMDNETAVTPAWGTYWAGYIRDKAAAQGRTVHTTEMWDPWNLDDAKHRNTFDHPETYTFVDISQNNHKTGQAHWDNAQKQRHRIAPAPRPLNNVKIYGADGGRFGSTQDAVERFWRNVFGGLASARFHRPDSGLGLNEIAQAHIHSARRLTGAIDWFSCEPNNALLSEREKNEAYCTAQPGKAYAIYFPHGGAVDLDVSAAEDTLTVRWLHIPSSAWSEKEDPGTRPLPLICPTKEHWAVLVTP